MHRIMYSLHVIKYTHYDANNLMTPPLKSSAKDEKMMRDE